MHDTTEYGHRSCDRRVKGTIPGILTHNEEEEEKHVDNSKDDGVQHGGHHERQGAHHDPILGADAMHPKAQISHSLTVLA